jgi:hypothetical protein
MGRGAEGDLVGLGRLVAENPVDEAGRDFCFTHSRQSNRV